MKKGTIMDWAFFAVVLVSIGFVIYTIYNISGSPEADKWLVKPLSMATMKDTLGVGGILVTLHAILSRSD